MDDPVRARPAALAAYERAAADMVDDLATAGDQLEVDLESFRATGTWVEFLGAVPPVELDVKQARLGLALVGEWVGTFGAALARLDADDGVVTADLNELSWLDRLRLSALARGVGLDGGPALRVHEGDAVLIGSADADLVEIVEVDGQLIVRVSNLDSSGSMQVTEEFPLPAGLETLTIRTGAGNDVVSVPPGIADTIELTFDVGRGNNVVAFANPDAPVMAVSGGDGIRVFAGDGNNTVHGSQGDDRIYLGGGDNDASGNAGDDLIITTGSGTNRISGGDGDDTIVTGTGDDYIDGGRGGDAIRSFGGDNVLVAGEGDGDVLIGGSGDDTFVGGRGQTDMISGGGSDRVYSGGPDAGHTVRGARDGLLSVVRIEVEGRPGEDAVRLQRPDGMSDAEWDAWSARVESDLEMLRHTPSGREGLQALDEDVGEGGMFWNRQPRIVVEPLVNRDGDTGERLGFDAEQFMQDGRQGQASVASSRDGVGYDTDARIGQDRNQGAATPSSVILYHELAHMYDYEANSPAYREGEYDEVILDEDGVEVSRAPLQSVDRHGNVRWHTPEVNAVGYDQDGDGRISDDETLGDHPGALTENEVRNDLGLPTRPGYGMVAPDPHRDVPDGGRVVYERRP